MDGALIWSYFPHNNDTQQLYLFGSFYSTGSSNADDYNIATDDHWNHCHFCFYRRVFIGKFFRYRSGHKEIHEDFICTTTTTIATTTTTKLTTTTTTTTTTTITTTTTMLLLLLLVAVVVVLLLEYLSGIILSTKCCYQRGPAD